MSAALLLAVAAAAVDVVLGSTAAQEYQRPGCAFRCRTNYKCIRYSQVCDGILDCPDEEDEICDDSTVDSMDLPKCIVGESQFCNGIKDCLDGSDEAKCPSTTLPPLVNLGTDWLWTWPLVGAVLCALVCLAVALSLRYMRIKRQRRRDARRLADRLAASAVGPGGGGAAYSPFNLPSYAEATGGTPFAVGCPNMGYCVNSGDQPPDYLEAIREAERQSALEKQLLQQRDATDVAEPSLLLSPARAAGSGESAHGQLVSLGLARTPGELGATPPALAVGLPSAPQQLEGDPSLAAAASHDTGFSGSGCVNFAAGGRPLPNGGGSKGAWMQHSIC